MFKHLNIEIELLFKIESSYVEDKSPKSLYLLEISVIPRCLWPWMNSLVCCHNVEKQRGEIGMLCGLNYLVLCGRKNEQLQWEE